MFDLVLTDKAALSSATSDGVGSAATIRPAEAADRDRPPDEL